MNLISRSLLFIIFYFLFSHARAQVGEYRTDLAIGFNGGYVMTNVSFTPDVPQDLLGGMTGGLTIRYTCEKYFSSICAITAEVNYTQAGWKERILDVNDHKYTYAIGTIYMDLINGCEKLGDYIVNVVEARTGTRMR